MFPLEKLCLDVILQNFARFYFSFTVSKDKRLQRLFEFLQRKYSDQLASDLHKKSLLEYQYLDFLINEHLNHLDDYWLGNSRFMQSLEDLFGRLPNLRKVIFENCGNEIMVNIAKFCPKIRVIAVCYSGVSDDGFKYLYETKNGKFPCPELREVFVEGSEVTHRGLENLIRNLPSLEKIDYPKLPLLLHSIYEKDLYESESIETFNLVELNFLDKNSLENVSIDTGVLKACLILCPKLESLACCISDEEQLNLLNNRNLKKLHFECIGDQKISIRNFLKLNGWKLTSFELTDCTISVSLLLRCLNLKKFSANRVDFEDDDDNNELKPNFACLTKCDFKAFKPSSIKAVCFILSSSPILESLTFGSCTLSAEIKEHILLWCRNPCAKVIHFINTFSIPLEMKILKQILQNCPSLTEMRLWNRPIDNTDPYLTEKIKTLKNIAKSLPNKPYFKALIF